MRMRIKRVRKINDREYEFEIETKTVTTFKIGKEWKQILEDLARKKGMTLSDIVREALNEEIHEIYDLGRDDRISIVLRLDILRELDRQAIKFHTPRTYIFHSKIAQYLRKEGVKIG
jgi:predicted transcriptional regulator